MFTSRSFLRRKGALEIFKFSLYLTLPLAAGLVYANPKVMNNIIMELRLIQYPEAGPKPPVGDEIFKYEESVRAVQKQMMNDSKDKQEKEKNVK